MHSVPQDFDAEAIRGVLDCMTPGAARVMWSSKTFEVSLHPCWVCVFD